MIGVVGDKLLPRLQVPSMRGRTIEEACHHVDELGRVVEEYVVAGVAHLEDLRLARLVELVVNNDRVGSLGRAKEISSAVYCGNGEVKVLKHAVFRVQGLIEEGKVVDAGQANNFNLAQTLNHEGVELRVRLSFLISEEFSRQELSDEALKDAVRHAVRDVV